MALIQIGTDLWVDPDRVISISRNEDTDGHTIYVDMLEWTARYKSDWSIDRVCRALGVPPDAT